MKKPNIIFPLVIFLLIPQLFALIGAYFTTPAISGWYATLIKSPLNPPSWIFAPVWTVLFLLMGVAAFLVWRKRMDPRIRKDDKRVGVALTIFGVQLVLNTLWSYLFFGLHNPGAALVEIVILWIAILATVITFYRVSKPASYLLLPYILWVSFAAVLNFSIWNLNKTTQPGGPVACTMEAKLCPDGSAVGRTGPNCEFAACPEQKIDDLGIPLPVGYSLGSYEVAEVLDQQCSKYSDCQTPAKYSIRSNCPYVTPCLQNKCTVVCPRHK